MASRISDTNICLEYIVKSFLFSNKLSQLIYLVELLNYLVILKQDTLITPKTLLNWPVAARVEYSCFHSLLS